MTRLDNQRHIAAPTGTELSAKSWLTEAPLRADLAHILAAAMAFAKGDR